MTPTADTTPRRRWPWILLAVVVAIAVLLVAAELVARAVVPGVVRGVVIDKLGLPAQQQLDVETEGVLLPQLLAGRLDSLRLSTAAITVGGITGAADLTAAGVPLTGGDFTGGKGTVRIDQDQFAALLDGSDLPIETVTLAGPDATVSGTLPVLGVPVPVSLTVRPGAQDGELLLTPVTLVAGGVTVDAAQVSSRFGTLGEQLTKTHQICVADRLPAGITLTGLAVDGQTAVADVDIDGAIVTDPALQENGVCR